MCGDYVTATVLGGAKGLMVGALIDSQFRGAQNWPQGSAMAVLMIVDGAAHARSWSRCSSGLVRRLARASLDRSVDRLSQPRPRPEPSRSRFPDLLRPVLAVWTGLVLVFLFIPILLVIRHSFNNGAVVLDLERQLQHGVVGRRARPHAVGHADGGPVRLRRAPARCWCAS